MTVKTAEALTLFALLKIFHFQNVLKIQIAKTVWIMEILEELASFPVTLVIL